MRRKVKSAITYIMVCIAAVLLTGCDLVPTLDLSEEESTLIAEYAAGKLLEYAKGHPGGLMTVEDIDRADVNPGMKKTEEEPEEQPAMPVPQDGDLMPPAQEGDMDGTDGALESDDNSEQEALIDALADISAEPAISLEEALGTGEAALSYDHYEIAATYPPNDTEIAFSMKAAAGKELLVLHFIMSNPTDHDIEVRTDSDNFKVRLALNGSDRLRGDITFLDNDLMNYSGILEPSAAADTVLVFEIPEGGGVSSMDLLIVVDGEEERYGLM